MLNRNWAVGLPVLALFLSVNSFGMGQMRMKFGSGGNTSASAGAQTEATPPPAASIPTLDNTSSSANSCGRLPENGFSKMSPTLNYFDDVSAGDYLLIRKPSIAGIDQYDIVLNYQFYGDNPDQIAPKVTECFESLTPYLLGPNGEQMHLRLPMPGDPMLPKAHPVTISDACGFRGEAECWRPVYSCATVLHETMHHLGLVDEYAELPCRSIGPADSLMTNPLVAFQAVTPKYALHSYTCNIFAGDDNAKCLHALDLIESGMHFAHDPATSFYSVTFDDGEIAPVHQSTDGPYFAQQLPELMSGNLVPAIDLSVKSDGWNIPDQSPTTLAALATQYAKPLRTDSGALNVVEVLPSPRKSILYPAEASTLLYGKCQVNTTFLTCEHGAYDTNFCGSKPAVCGKGQPSDAWLQLPN